MADDKSTAPARAPSPQPPLTDRDRRRLDELRAMEPGKMPERNPAQEAELLALQRRNRDALWAAQDARLAELEAKRLSYSEEKELAALKQEIDNQRRAAVRRADILGS